MLSADAHHPWHDRAPWRHAEGSIYRRNHDGRYVSALTWTDPTTEARRRTTYYGQTCAEVRAKLDAALERRRQDLPVKDATVTLAAWAQHWVDTALPASPRKATTKELYASLVRSHVLAASVARRRLNELHPSHIDAFVLELARKPLPGTSRGAASASTVGLADAAVQRVFDVLRQILRQILDGAVRDGVIAKNPASEIKSQRIASKEARFPGAPSRPMPAGAGHRAGRAQPAACADAGYAHRQRHHCALDDEDGPDVGAGGAAMVGHP